MADDYSKILTELAKISAKVDKSSEDIEGLKEGIKSLTLSNQKDHTQLHVILSELQRNKEEFQALTARWDNRFKEIENDVTALQHLTDRWIGKLVGLGIAVSVGSSFVAIVMVEIFKLFTRS